jgi:hypothetical protein
MATPNDQELYAEIKQGEYPFCMPLSDARRYIKSDLVLLFKRKNEIGKRTLDKDTFLKKNQNKR